MTRASDTAKLLGAGATILDGTTISTADNTEQLILTSTDADANAGPVISFKRDSSSPADNDLLGSITFKGENSASEEITYAKIQSKLKDATDGTEDGNISCEIIIDGTSRELLTVTRDSVVVNQDSQDIDFRVEGNGDANLLVCDAGSDFVAIGESSQVNGGKLSIATSASDSVLSFLCRSTTNSHQPEIIMQKSSAASGNFAATADGEALGSIAFRGVDTQPVSQIAAAIDIVQVGTASGSVPADMRFSTGGSERMRTGGSTGNFFVGTTSTSPNPGFVAHPTGQIGIGKNNSNSGGSFIEFRRNATQIGSVTQNGTTGVTYGTSSDYRLKENVTTSWDATTRLKQLKPSRFNFIAEPDRTVDGFLAHEVSSIVPEAVIGEKDATETYTDDDGNEQTRISPQAIDQAKLVPLLVKTIQELEARITTLENA